MQLLPSLPREAFDRSDLDKMILVSGLSKSGKTQTLQRAAKFSLPIEHVKASTLLRAKNQPLSLLRYEEVINNQTVLLEALAEYPHELGTVRILDGHALIEAIEGPVLLPDWVFDRLSLCGIIVIIAPPEIIAHRRAGTDLEQRYATLERFQRLEETHCASQAERLSITFRTVVSGDAVELAKSLLRMIEPEGKLEGSH